MYGSKAQAKTKKHFDNCAFLDLMDSWKPHTFADLDFLYVSNDFIQECPCPPTLSEKQKKKIEEQTQKLLNGEPVPPLGPKIVVPLAPSDWSPT